MQFDTTYLTEAGRSLATGTLGGLDKIQFTRAVASSHDYSATPVNDLKKLTSIEDVQQTVEYSRIIKKDDTTLTMRVDFPSKDVTTAYSLYTVGFYARPENGDEILYGVLPSSLPDYIAAYDGKSNLNDSFQTDTTVSDADNVLITVSQAGSLNEADLDAIFASKHIATIDDIKANIPATVIDGSKPADFKESVTLEKGAVDGAGNAIATTKNLADGDAETLTSAKDYADTQAGDKVKAADTANWQKQALFNPGGYSIGSVPRGSDYATYVKANFSNPGIYYIRDQESGMQSVDGATISVVDSVLISEGLGYYYAYGVAVSGDFVFRAISPTKDTGWKRSADVDSIDPSVMVKRTLTADDDVLTLDTGTYYTWGAKPKNFPATLVSWSTIVVQTVGNQPLDGKNVTITDTHASQLINTYSGSASTGKWSGWRMPNENSVVKDNGDDTVTINRKTYVPANAANVVDRNPDTGTVSKPTDFTNLTVNGGKSVATRDDLKSLEGASWRELDLSGTSGLYKGKIYAKIDETSKRIYLMGDMYFSGQVRPGKGDTLLDLSSVATSLSSAHGYIFFINGKDESATQVDMRENAGNQASTLSCSGSKLTVGSGVSWNYAANHILFFPDAGMSAVYVTYSSLV